MPYNTGIYGSEIWGSGGTFMAHRSLFRPDQLDSNGSYNFAQLILDGYSGGDLEDGYLMGLVLTDGYTGGVDTIKMDAHTGAITQLGTGQVSFAGNVDATNGLDVSGANLTCALDAIIDGNLRVKTNTILEGNLTVQGTMTSVETEQMIVTDPVTVLNASGEELSANFAGFSARDEDGYNRLGWVFQEGSVDGYWAISSAFTSGSDVTPDHAIAFLGLGETNGDLSSTVSGDSGADKIGVSTISGVAGNDVQTILENLASGSAELNGTTNNNFVVNSDAVAVNDEDACLVMKGGDGTSLIEGYMCLVTVSGTDDDYFQFRIYDDGVDATAAVHIGLNGTTNDTDSELYFNAGNGTDGYQTSIVVDGTGMMTYTSVVGHTFSGDVSMSDDLGVLGSVDVGVDLDVTGATTLTGTLTANGDVYLGSDSSDSVDINGTIVSDLLPTNDTYYVGSPTQTWVDGYFNFFTPTNYTPVGDGYSLEAHLKGIDAALADATVDHPRGIYIITTAEGSADELVSTRTPDQGDTIDVSGLTDDEFRDNVYVYWNGQLLVCDAAPAINSAAVVSDVARKTGSLGTLVFAGNIRKGAVIQIVDLR